MGTIKNTNTNVISSSTRRISAINTHLTNAKMEITINGESLKPATLLERYQQSIDTRAAVTVKYGEYQSALAARDAAEAVRLKTDEGLKYWVLNKFGADSPEARAFGYAPRKVAQRSAE